MHNAAFALNQPFLLVLVSYCYWNKFYKPSGSELIYFSAIVEMSSQKRASVSSEYGTKMLVGCVPWGCVQPVTHRLHVAEGSYECTPPQNYKRKSCEVFAVVFVFGCMVLLLIPKKILIFILYVWVCCLHECLCTMYMQCLRWPEEGIGCTATGVTDDYDLPYGCWELNPHALEEQTVLLTAE